MKYLEQIGTNFFKWPTTPDNSEVGDNRLFHGPVVLQLAPKGYTVNEDELVIIREKHSALKKVLK